MAIATVLCEWIYGTFLTLKVALEAGVLYAKKIMNVFDSALKAFALFAKGLMALTIQKTIEACKVIMKAITDMLIPWDVKSSLICTALYRCSFVLEKLLDPSSMITKTLKQFKKYDSTFQEQLYAMIKDYNKFKAQICAFGFTIEMGLGALRDLLMGWKATIEGYIDMVLDKYDYYHRLIQSYLDKIIEYGIGDLLETLSQLFNCVILDSVETCASIATSSSFYKWTTSSLGIEQCGDDYQMKPAFIEGKLNWINSFSKQLGTVNKKLEALLDTMMSPESVNAASNAFNLADLFSGVDNIWKYGLKEGIKHLAIYKAITGTISDLKAAWNKTVSGKDEGDEQLNNVSDNFILTNTTYDSTNENAKLYVDGYPIKDIYANMVTKDCKHDLYIDGDLGKINLNGVLATENGLYSVTDAAISCFKAVNDPNASDDDKAIYEFCKKAANTINELYTEDELMVRY